MSGNASTVVFRRKLQLNFRLSARVQARSNDGYENRRIIKYVSNKNTQLDATINRKIYCFIVQTKHLNCVNYWNKSWPHIQDHLEQRLQKETEDLYKRLNR